MSMDSTPGLQLIATLESSTGTVLPRLAKESVIQNLSDFRNFLTVHRYRTGPHARLEPTTNGASSG